MKLSSEEKQKILEAIQRAESHTQGEIRVHLSYDLTSTLSHTLTHAPLDMLALTKKTFEKLNMHLTEKRNGMLLYINPRIKKFALYGDIGIHEKVKQEFWDHLREELTETIHKADLTTGIILAVEKMGFQLKQFFPSEALNQNELSNEITESE